MREYYYLVFLQDYPLRAACGVGILILLFLLTAASIVLLALT